MKWDKLRSGMELQVDLMVRVLVEPDYPSDPVCCEVVGDERLMVMVRAESLYVPLMPEDVTDEIVAADGSV